MEKLIKILKNHSVQLKNGLDGAPSLFDVIDSIARKWRDFSENEKQEITQCCACINGGK